MQIWLVLFAIRKPTRRYCCSTFLRVRSASRCRVVSDEGLEMFAIYSSLREKKGPIPLNNAWLPTIQVVLSSFEQMLPDEHDDEDKAELKLWMEILNEARDAATNPEIQ